MNKKLLTPFIAFTCVVVFAVFYYQYTMKETVPGENQFRFANKNLEDGNYDEALRVFDEVIAQYPDYTDAHMGRAITLMQLGMFVYPSVCLFFWLIGLIETEVLQRFDI